MSRSRATDAIHRPADLSLTCPVDAPERSELPRQAEVRLTRTGHSQTLVVEADPERWRLEFARDLRRAITVYRNGDYHHPQHLPAWVESVVEHVREGLE